MTNAIGRPMPPLILDDVERETLERWARRPRTAQALALRARMILGCAEGWSNTAVGADLGVSDATVDKWRSRQGGLARASRFAIFSVDCRGWTPAHAAG